MIGCLLSFSHLAQNCEVLYHVLTCYHCITSFDGISSVVCNLQLGELVKQAKILKTKHAIACIQGSIRGIMNFVEPNNPTHAFPFLFQDIENLKVHKSPTVETQTNILNMSSTHRIHLVKRSSTIPLLFETMHSHKPTKVTWRD